jgi:ketosteroid isomerase-like protein
MAAFRDPPRRRPLAAGRSAATSLGFLTALASLLVAGCDRKGGAEEIRALVEKEVKAINAEDLKALSEIWAQDETILLFDVPPPGRFQGWDKIGRLWKEFFDKFSEVHLTIDGLQVQVEGSLGYATYDWTLTGRMGEYAVDDRGRATAIYRRQNAAWKLVHAHYSPVFPALAEPTPAPAAVGEDASR